MNSPEFTFWRWTLVVIGGASIALFALAIAAFRYKITEPCKVVCPGYDRWTRQPVLILPDSIIRFEGQNKADPLAEYAPDWQQRSSRNTGKKP